MQNNNSVPNQHISEPFWDDVIAYIEVTTMADTFFSISDDVTLQETNIQTFPFPEVQLTITRSGDLSGENEVIYESVNGTADAGQDYFGTTFVRLRFAPGETTKTITLNLFGDTTFEPDETFFGRLRDATNGATITRDTATVTILNDDPNQSPDAVNDTATTDEDTGLTAINVLDNDTDVEDHTLTVIDVDMTGTQGLIIDNGDGTFDYDPNGQFEFLNDGETETDSFTYTIDDGFGGTDTATVTVTIEGSTDNGIPVAGNDGGVGFTTDESTSFTTASVLDNDSDPDGDTLTIVDVDTTGTQGLVIDNGDGTFDYDPNGQFEVLNDGETATDEFTYTIDDGNGGTDIGTVTITIEGESEAPESPSFYFSGTRGRGGTVESLSPAKSDIVFYDGTDFTTFFDGSDVLPKRTAIDAFDVISDTEILMSFKKPTAVEGVGQVDDSDVVKFVADAPDTFGTETSGRFELYVDGSELGLTKNSEDIDGLSQLPNGDLLISTSGRTDFVDGLQTRGEDMVQLSLASTGVNTSASLSQYFDGSDVGLTDKGEDLDAISVQGQELLFSTSGNWVHSNTQSGRREDVGSFTGTLGSSSTSGNFGDTLFFDGSSVGFTGNLTGLDVNVPSDSFR